MSKLCNVISLIMLILAIPYLLLAPIREEEEL